MENALITPGKIKQSFFAEAEREYAGRIRKFCPFRIIEVREEKLLKNTDVSSVKRAESLRIQEKIPSGSAVIVLDEHGKNLTSHEFATAIKNLEEQSQKITFLIGGANGLAEELQNRAAAVYSLGKMTMSQDLARVVFLEQLYRAFTINAGLPYHRE